MRLRLVAPFLPALVAALVGAAGPAAATTAPTYRDLVYVHYDGNHYALWTVGAGIPEAALGTSSDEAFGGTAATGTGTRMEHMPTFSPDGTFLAFEGRRTGTAEDGVYLQDTSTGAVTIAADAKDRVEGPTGWYADTTGQHVIYVRDRTGDATHLDAWEVPIASDGTAGTPRPLTQFPGSLMNVTAVGHTLVFDYGTTHTSPDHRICTAPLVAGTSLPTTPTCLTDGTSDDRAPSVAPNGDIAFARAGAPRPRIMVLHGTRGQWAPSTSKNTTTLSLPTTLKAAGYPQYSPSGTTLAFAGGPTTSLSSYDIYTVPAAGGTPKRLTSLAGTDYLPTWKP